MKKQHLTLPLLVSSLAAQYTGEVPTVMTPYAAYAPLGIASVGNGTTHVWQSRLVPHASLPANTYYACLTVGVTAATDFKLMSGTFNTVTGVFTKNTDADGLNTGFTTSELFALTVTNDLLTAAFDTAAGVRWASRANTTSPFTLQTGVVTGVGSGAYLDPNFGRVGGKDVLFYTTQSAISFGDFAAGAVTNVRTVTTITGTSVHSPMPANDSTGTTRALHYVQTATGTAPFKLQYASSLTSDAGAPPYTYYTDTVAANWLENGNVTGGTTTIISGANNYVTPFQIGIAAVNSSTYTANTPVTVNITSFAPQQAPTAVPYLGATAIGNLGTAGIPILPGLVTGNLSLNPVGIVMLPSGQFSTANGTFEQNLPGVNLPVGVKIWMQTLVVDVVASKIYLSNTGKLEWK